MVVYPRWRGELDRTASVVSSGSGLSPLARGTHTPLSNSCDLPTVYPRWRGEHIDPEQQYAQTDGLSPLARGTLPYILPDIIFLRFIPAGAGNTTSGCRRSAWSPVYPRWRGEHCMALASSLTDAGLSPLARGTHISEQKTKPQPRFIPAGAGNTIKKLFCVSFRSVYPRWHGEHFYSVNNRSLIVGLSPLARGTPAVGTVKLRYCRFIPAGAGNTIEIVFGIYSEAVYPRWRGEHP